MNLKKLVALTTGMTFVIGTSSSTVATTINTNNQLIHKNILNGSENDFNRFVNFPGTKGQIQAMTTDKDGNVFAGSKNGTIYGSLFGLFPFVPMDKDTIEGNIKAMTTDNDGNVFMAKTISENQTIIYHEVKINGKIMFEELYTISYQVTSMVIDKTNKLYIGTTTGIYARDQFSSSFTKIMGTNGQISSITALTNPDADIIIFAGNNTGDIFQSYGNSSFTLISSTPQLHKISGLTVDNNTNDVYAVSTAGQVLIKRANLTTFNNLKNVIPTKLTSVIVDKASNVYVGGQNGVVYKNAFNNFTPNFTKTTGTGKNPILCLNINNNNGRFNTLYAGTSITVYGSFN